MWPLPEAKMTELVRLSKVVAHALRHDPGSYGLALDSEGWTSLDALLTGLHRRSRWRDIGHGELVEMIRRGDKQRFEIEDDRIRALYGHSVPGRIVRPLAQPPEVLFHGTTASALPAIRKQGLRSMSRQYVHLSVDELTAAAVGRRRGRDVVVLGVAAGAASEASVEFWRGNESVWLADHIPPRFLLDAVGG